MKYFNEIELCGSITPSQFELFFELLKKHEESSEVYQYITVIGLCSEQPSIQIRTIKHKIIIGLADSVSKSQFEMLFDFANKFKQDAGIANYTCLAIGNICKYQQSIFRNKRFTWLIFIRIERNRFAITAIWACK